jgi:hypothetical protein
MNRFLALDNDSLNGKDPFDFALECINEGEASRKKASEVEARKD